MTMKQIRLLLIAVYAALCIPVNAQTFHLVSMFDTNDSNIGTGMQVEKLLFSNDMQTILGLIESFGYDCEVSEYYGNSCGKAPLMRAIQELNVGKDDVVMFYYGGHGSRANDSREDDFPQMCLGEPNPNNWVPSSLIKNMIAKKNPRLTIVMTGCCNKEQDGVTVKGIEAQSPKYTSLAGIDSKAFEELFLKIKGVVQLTSSKKGEYSYCSSGYGSVFCRNLLEVFKEVGKGSISPDWNSVCSTVQNRVGSKGIPTKEGTAWQHPYYRVNVSPVGAASVDRRDENSTKRVNDVESTLANDLKTLLDKSNDIDNRLGQISGILSRNFTSNAKVMTLGRDMKTVVDYEDAEDFLRRIAMSPFIQQVNIVEQNEGKSQLIKVHEVRTR